MFLNLSFILHALLWIFPSKPSFTIAEASEKRERRTSCRWWRDSLQMKGERIWFSGWQTSELTRITWETSFTQRALASFWPLPFSSPGSLGSLCKSNHLLCLTPWSWLYSPLPILPEATRIASIWQSKWQLVASQETVSPWRRPEMA